ncbi:hypothetical protein BBD42_13125 [Paenibacillus sp. BIHB 4019]|uniref:Uncharacterized protein n=1 Tax=Paenibacillus sp. BIHB 4019 TaxID=1870819 RepID=A0A1B2DHY7_9BACL|nr:hypothetical protein [Paenibacillus sp. BIHB 4019]ANY67311.1 hypothetical protein BBD42_13125 [Paenibacillus sp. BIHB 4019]
MIRDLNYRVVRLAVPSGANTTSSYADIKNASLISFRIPAGYDGGAITIQASDIESGTFVDVYDSAGNLLTVPVGGADRVVSLTGAFLQAVSSLRFIKLKCASNVGANREIVLIGKG